MNRAGSFRVVFMGPAGSGKTSLGQELAARLAVDFIDADQLHPPENVDKMHSGVPLTDTDRWPWLDRVAREIRAYREADRSLLLACSALKRRYRERLRAADGELRFVLLNAPLSILEQRVKRRVGHFMPAGLVQDQCHQLEPPGADEIALTLDADRPLQELAGSVLEWLRIRVDG